MTDKEIAAIRERVQLLMESPLDSHFRQVTIMREFRDDLCADFNALLAEVGRLRMIKNELESVIADSCRNDE